MRMVIQPFQGYVVEFYLLYPGFQPGLINFKPFGLLRVLMEE
jgi:hypothetical protein